LAVSGRLMIGIFDMSGSCIDRLLEGCGARPRLSSPGGREV
jgi:hypothetical protein